MRGLVVGGDRVGQLLALAPFRVRVVAGPEHADAERLTTGSVGPAKSTNTLSSARCSCRSTRRIGHIQGVPVAAGDRRKGRGGGLDGAGRRSPYGARREAGPWQAYRQKWATERKHFPDVDVAPAGGWKTVQTLKSAYQHADAETMLRVVFEGGELREAR